MINATGLRCPLLAFTTTTTIIFTRAHADRNQPAFPKEEFSIDVPIQLSLCGLRLMRGCGAEVSTTEI